MLVEERLKTWTKGLLTSAQQKFDLSNATIPPFATFAKWFAIGGGAVVLSAAANTAIIKYFLFPSIKNIKSSKAAESADAPGLVMVLDKPKTDDFKDIFKRNIFNSEQKEEVVKEGSGTNQCVPVKSDMPLKFTGVIFGGTKETSLVLIESTGSRQADTFLLNDMVSIPPSVDAQITDIQRDKVFFLRKDSPCQEFLELQQPEIVKKRVPGVPRSQAPSLSASAGSSENEFCESGFCRNKGGNIVADRRWVDRALTSDMAKTLQDAKASPNLVNGEVKGFVLTRIRPDSVYEKMGFQDGDVVENINGIDLNDAARAIQTLNALRNENSIELSVKRNGVTMPLKIQVK